MGCALYNVGASNNAGSVVVFTRNAANTGFDVLATELTEPTVTAADECGFSVAIGDLNDDMLGDIATGCQSDDTGVVDSGGAHTRDGATTR